MAELLRGDYKQSEYGRVILPFLVLRRLDQVLAPSRASVLAADARFPADRTPLALREQMLLKASGETFYNTSKLDFGALLEDPNNAAANLTGYVHGFSKNVRDLMDRFRFEEQVARLDASNLLFLVLRKFVAVDLDPYLRKPGRGARYFGKRCSDQDEALRRPGVAAPVGRDGAFDRDRRAPEAGRAAL